MIHTNCLFCKIRPGVQSERIKASANNNGLEIVVMDGDNCLAKFKGSVPERLPDFINRLKNTLLFSAVTFSGSAFVGKA